MIKRMLNKCMNSKLAKAVYIVLSIILFASCQGNDYVNAIPDDSMMLIKMNTAKLSGAKSPLILKTLLRVSNIGETGLDLSQNVYFFEDANGNLGLCAKVDDEGKLEKTIEHAGVEVTEKHDFHFAYLPSGWLLGYSKESALLMGPIVADQQTAMMRTVSRYLSATEEDGIKGTPMYDKLDSIDAPMAIVSQAKALPEQFVAPFTIGAPKDTDPADIILAAGMEVKDNRLLMSGHTLSFKKSVDKALREANSVYRPIKGKYTGSMSKDDVVGMFLNVDGASFHQLITKNRGISAMLAGINSAIDMDNILRSVDGDLALVTSSVSKENVHMKMAAQLSAAPWLEDVDYWKQSVPKGGRIGDWGKNCFYYTGDGTTYYFGVAPDMQYMSGGSAEEALSSIKACDNPIDSDLQQMIAGQKLVMIVNFAALKGDKAGAVMALLRPMFGNVNIIVYTFR